MTVCVEVDAVDVAVGGQLGEVEQRNPRLLGGEPEAPGKLGGLRGGARHRLAQCGALAEPGSPSTSTAGALFCGPAPPVATIVASATAPQAMSSGGSA